MIRFRPLIVPRVGAGPMVPGSTRDMCRSCGYGVWIRPSDRADRTPDSTVICEPCADREIRIPASEVERYLREQERKRRRLS